MSRSVSVTAPGALPGRYTVDEIEYNGAARIVDAGGLFLTLGGQGRFDYRRFGGVVLTDPVFHASGPFSVRLDVADRPTARRPELISSPRPSPSSAAAAPTVVHLDTVADGTNSATLTFTAENPSYSIGDLVLVSATLDRGAAQVTPVSLVAPNGETVTTAVNGHENTLTGTGGTSQWVFWYVATSAVAQGENLALTCTTNAEQWGVTTSVFDAGTFDPADPIADIATGFADDDELGASSPATTATRTGGMVLFLAGLDGNDFDAMPLGWVRLDSIDVGAQAACAAAREAGTTAGAVVPAATFRFENRTSWCGVTLVVNPA